MDPLRIYDYLVLARACVFGWVRPLSDDEYRRTFPISLGSIARILTHVLMSEWLYVARLKGQDVPAYVEWPIQDEDPPPFAVIESRWVEQAAQTRNALAAVDNWNRSIVYHSIPDLGPPRTSTTTPADLMAQIAFHEVHHRAQVLNILRQLGVGTSDIDFNALMKSS